MKRAMVNTFLVVLKRVIPVTCILLHLVELLDEVFVGDNMLLDLSTALVENLHRHMWLSAHHLVDLVVHVVVFLWFQVGLLKLILLVHNL